MRVEARMRLAVGIRTLPTSMKRSTLNERCVCTISLCEHMCGCSMSDVCACIFWSHCGYGCIISGLHVHLALLCVIASSWFIVYALQFLFSQSVSGFYCDSLGGRSQLATTVKLRNLSESVMTLIWLHPTKTLIPSVMGTQLGTIKHVVPKISNEVMWTLTWNTTQIVEIYKKGKTLLVYAQPFRSSRNKMEMYASAGTCFLAHSQYISIKPRQEVALLLFLLTVQLFLWVPVLVLLEFHIKAK